MRCPRCQGPMRTAKTVSNAPGEVRRRRVCRNARCGYAFNTTEIDAAALTGATGRARQTLAAIRQMVTAGGEDDG